MVNVLSRLLPRQHSFFTQFTEVTANIEEGARALAAIFHDYRDVHAQARHIKDLEHKGDQLTHEIFTTLNQTFITPFDREDIHALTSKLDDILDLIDAVAARLVIYGVDEPRPGAAELADILVRATAEVHAAVSRLEKQDGILDHCIEINSLENEADTAVRAAIARLFREEKDPVELIKWKEILEVLEIASDKCEDVANILESVVLKST
ncbi:MAG: DUF47 domain-containing protein [Anaerolineae bacterium]